MAGTLVVLCAVVAAAAAAVPGRSETSFAGLVRFEGNYPAVVWPLMICLAVCGLRMRSRRAAVVAAVVGAQIAGHGIVVVRDWFNAWGAGGMATHNLATVVTLAAAVAVCGAVATCVGVGVAWREPADWAALRPATPRYVVAGLVVLLALPPALSAVFDDVDMTSLGQYALSHSIPWGAGLASAGWLDRRTGSAAIGAVGAAAVFTAVAAVAIP